MTQDETVEALADIYTEYGPKVILMAIRSVMEMTIEMKWAPDTDVALTKAILHIKAAIEELV
jgi:hypothetical protein